MGLEECHASVVAALAGGWHARCDASADSGRGRRKRYDPLGVWRRRWRFFPLARVGARASPAGGKAKGFSSTASQRETGCLWRTGPHRPMGTNGRKGSRRLVVRWERITACFEAFLTLATIHIWVHRLLVG